MRSTLQSIQMDGSMHGANMPPHQNYRKPLSTLEFSQASTDIVGGGNASQHPQGVPNGAPPSMLHQQANMTSLTFSNHPQTSALLAGKGGGQAGGTN